MIQNVKPYMQDAVIPRNVHICQCPQKVRFCLIFQRADAEPWSCSTLASLSRLSRLCLFFQQHVQNIMF